MKISKQTPSIHNNIPVNKYTTKKDISQFKEKISISSQPQEGKKIEDKFLNRLEEIANEFFRGEISSIPQVIEKVVEMSLKDRFSPDIYNTKFFIDMNSAITNFIQKDPNLTKQLEVILAKLAKEVKDKK